MPCFYLTPNKTTPTKNFKYSITRAFSLCSRYLNKRW